MRIALRVTEESVKPNKCGECRACCTVLAIQQLEPQKPNWTPCPHECGNGCSIYQSKPEECNEYQCHYLEGVFGSDPAFRPDKLGLLVDMRGVTDDMDYPHEVYFFQIWETRLNARFEKRARAMIQKLVDERKIGVVLRKYGQPASKMEILGSKKMVREVTDFLIWQVQRAKQEQGTESPII